MISSQNHAEGQIPEGPRRENAPPRPIDALLRLLRGQSDPDTDESRRASARAPVGHRHPTGFVNGSEAWVDARAIGAEITPAPDPGPPHTPDLFTTPAPARYEVTLELPVALAGSAPQGYEHPPYPPLEHGTALGWDSDHVVVQCPRGICTLSRAQWARGERYCDGC